MMYEKAIATYVHALIDIARALDTYRELRTEFDPGFLSRVMRDGFLRPVSDSDRDRILYFPRAGEEFLLWQGTIRRKKMGWNCIGWIFPFYTDEEMERSYEIVTRAKLAQKSWAMLRQLALSCRQSPLDIPINLVKVRVVGDECRSAMRTLEKTPPNLRYVTKTMLGQLPPSNYLRERIRVKLFVGEKLGPYVQASI